MSTQSRPHRLRVLGLALIAGLVAVCLEGRGYSVK
jgi:hypothetical protein